MSLTLTTLDIGPADDEDNILMSAPFLFTRESPGQRAYVVDGPISYVCNPATGRLLRYAGYNYQSAQPTTQAEFGVTPARVVSQLSACNMTYNAGTAARGGLFTSSISA